MQIVEERNVEESLIFEFIYLFMEVMFELRALCLLYCLSHTSCPFLFWLLLEMVSHKLFAQAGLEPRSFCLASQVARIIDVNH
jgi:hypothetical protein